jgi:uncharacterized membrane protein
LESQRVIPPGGGNEITEFPLFTFLYSDLHAHMLAMPLALLAVAWAVGVLRARRVSVLTLLIGGVAIGALYPTNLSDIYTYLPIGFAALAYSIWRSDAVFGWFSRIPERPRKLIMIAACILLLTVFAYGLYQPYRKAQWAGTVEAWKGPTRHLVIPDGWGVPAHHHSGWPGDTPVAGSAAHFAAEARS